MPDIYPDLIGIAPEIGMTPVFDNAIATSAAGIETPVSYREFPQWQLELSYEYIPNSVAKPHLQQIQGLFLKMRGNFGRFLFRMPECDFSAGVQLGIGDDTTTGFTLLRDTNGFLEPVGAIDPDFPIEVTVDGAVVDPADYVALDRTLTFLSAPASDATISATFKYFFLCRFEEASQRFDRFMWQLWEAKSVNLRSLIQ